MSAPVLSEYLKGLEKGGITDRQLRGRRIEYYLTEKAKESEQLRRRYLAIALETMAHARGKSFGAAGLFEFAQQTPQLLDAFVQWIWDITDLMTGDDFLRWAKSHPDEGRKLMKAELRKRIPASFQLGTSPIGAPLLFSFSETLTMFQKILDAMREVVSTGLRG